MRYLLKKCIAQAFKLEQLTGYSVKDLLRGYLIDIYSCGDCVDDEVYKILENETFKKLQSSKQIDIYRNYINSFCLNPKAFGLTSIEKSFIELKYESCVFGENLRNLSSFNHNGIENLAKCYSEDDDLSITYALLVYVNSKKQNTDIVLPLLRKASSKGKAEATVILMNVDGSQDKQALYEKLKSSKEMLVRKNELSEIGKMFDLWRDNQ